jgi:hypothetical protein
MRIFILTAFVLWASLAVSLSGATAAGLCDAAAENDCASQQKVCDPNTGACVSSQTTGSPTTQGQTTGVPTGSNATLLNPLQGGASLESFLNSILAFVIRIGTIVVILMLVYVGYLFVAARGNESKITEARKALLWTIIGALILLGAKAIAIGIEATVQALSVGQ